MNNEARRSLPERSASVKSTSRKSFQQKFDSDKSVFLNETGPTIDGSGAMGAGHSLATDRPAVFNGTYLVADADAERFHALARELAAECAPAGLDLSVTGPWPAYNFVRIDLSAGAEP